MKSEKRIVEEVEELERRCKVERERLTQVPSFTFQRGEDSYEKLNRLETELNTLKWVLW